MGTQINSDKIILDLCGGTGSWSKPYKDAGYDVRVITLPDYDIRTYEPPDNVYGILAAPPCTMFSIARTTAKAPRDLKAGMEIVVACLRIIWQCRFQKKLAFWALENPMGILRQFLGKPALTFQPNEFGDLHTKRTDIWGWFNMPKKKPVALPEGLNASMANNNRILPQLPEGYREPGKRNAAARRAMTPPGFATAFFKANK